MMLLMLTKILHQLICKIFQQSIGVPHFQHILTQPVNLATFCQQPGVVLDVCWAMKFPNEVSQRDMPGWWIYCPPSGFAAIRRSQGSKSELEVDVQHSHESYVLNWDWSRVFPRTKMVSWWFMVRKYQLCVFILIGSKKYYRHTLS